MLRHGQALWTSDPAVHWGKEKQPDFQNGWKSSLMVHPLMLFFKIALRILTTDDLDRVISARSRVRAYKQHRQNGGFC